MTGLGAAILATPVGGWSRLSKRPHTSLFLPMAQLGGQEMLICDGTEVEVSYRCFSSSALAIGGTEASIGAGWLMAAILFAKRRHYSEQLSLPTFRDCVL